MEDHTNIPTKTEEKSSLLTDLPLDDSVPEADPKRSKRLIAIITSKLLELNAFVICCCLQKSASCNLSVF